MKHVLYCALLLLFPLYAHSTVHIITQTSFLTGQNLPTAQAGDQWVILGESKVSFHLIKQARRKISKNVSLLWMLSDRQWHANHVSLDKDEMALNYAHQLENISIGVVPANLCPRPTIIEYPGFHLVFLDSSWFLFKHKYETFAQACGKIDLNQYYVNIEQAILNAKGKATILLAQHPISPKLIQGHLHLKKDIGEKIQQSISTLDGISGSSYQKYQKKIQSMLNKRSNTAYISMTSHRVHKDFLDQTYHLALTQNQSKTIQLTEIAGGVQIKADFLSLPIDLRMEQKSLPATSMCRRYRGKVHAFPLKKGLYKVLLGENHKAIWNQNISIPCFDLQKNQLTVIALTDTFNATTFEIKDQKNNPYLLIPLISEVNLPRILRNTLVEKVWIDQQSSFFPMSYMLANELSKKAGIAYQTSGLVYVDTHQSAFANWQHKKIASGYFHLVKQSPSLQTSNKQHKKIYSTQEMVDLLENSAGYSLDQRAYLKARLFDILIGDWERQEDQWSWQLKRIKNRRVFSPLPLNRKASFYKADGAIAWWERQAWVNYKLQSYDKRMHHANPMMSQSLSMDHRFTSKLTMSDWDRILAQLLADLSPGFFAQTLRKLPIKLRANDQKWLQQSFQKRLQELPALAKSMRQELRKSVDWVGTASNDIFTISTDNRSGLKVSQKSKGQGLVFEDHFDPQHTKEIRIYGLGGHDQYVFHGQKKQSIKIKMIPGDGIDKISAPPKLRISRDAIFDDQILINEKKVYPKHVYKPEYNAPFSHINQRKWNFSEPVLFLVTSDIDSGFTMGGGVRFNKEGFQKYPWASTNEIKANVVPNRSAINMRYEGNWFDFTGDSDFQTIVDLGLPRFYGSFFGLGNATPDLDPNQNPEFYWIRARNFETTSKINIPLIQHLFLVPQLKLRLKKFITETPSVLTTPSENNIDSILGAGALANSNNLNAYLGTGVALEFLSNDMIQTVVKKKGARLRASYMYQRGLTQTDGKFHQMSLQAKLIGFRQKSQTQWKLAAGYDRNFGQWEFFDAQFLGQGQDLRGFFRNRFAGSSRIYHNIEINQSLLRNSLWKVITDFGVGGHFDYGRTYVDNDISGSQRWHKSAGGQMWVTILHSVAFKASYSRALYQDQSGFWSFGLTSSL